MPTACRTVAAAFVLSLHMVLQCSGKIPSAQQRKHQVKIQEKQLNSTNQTAGDTITVAPVIPYVFFAEDYDVLQNAESLKKALSIVAYEPQKIDAKKPKVDATKGNATLVTTPSVQLTTEPAPEKQYYEVPRRSLRSRRAYVKPAEGTDTARLSEEASAPRLAYELAPEAKQRSIARPYGTPDVIPSPSPEPLTTERTTTEQPHSPADTPSRSRKKRRKHRQTKTTEQPQVQVQARLPSTTPMPLDRVPRPFSAPTDASPTSSNQHDRRHPLPVKPTESASTASAEPPGAYSSVSLRHSGQTGLNKLEQTASAAVPVEHAYLPPYATDDLFFAPPQGSAQPNNHLYATPYSSVTVDRNSLAPHSTASVAVDQQHGPPYSSAPVDPVPPRQYPTSYSTPPTAQRRTTTYPREPEQQEPIGTRQSYHSRRHSPRPTEHQWEYNDARPTRPATAGGTRQDDPYAAQRRRSRARAEHTFTATSSYPPEHQTLGYGSVPTRSNKRERERSEVYLTSPSWREEALVYPTAKSRREGRPPRRKDDPAYAAKPPTVDEESGYPSKSPRRDKGSEYPSKPPKRDDEPSYAAKQSRREEERSYSTKPPRREEERSYSTKPPRREEERSYSTKPPRRDEERGYVTKAPRREEESFYSLSRQEVRARPTASTRREQKSYPITEEKQSSSTESSSQSEEQDESTVSSGSEEEQTPPPRREHSQNYQSSSPRRAKPTLIIAVEHTAAPNEEVVEVTRPPHSRKPLPEDDEDYEQDVAPPVASVEQSLDYANDPQPSQALKQQQRPPEYQEYLDATDYADYTEPRPTDKEEDQDKEPEKKKQVREQDKGKDKGKEKDNDNREYNYSYVERVEEPLDESGEASYNVHEVSDEVPEQPQPRPADAHPVLQRGGYKIVQPIVVGASDQRQQKLPPADYPDHQESRKPDQEIAQDTRHQRQKPKGDHAEDLAQSAGHHHKKHHKPKEHKDEEEGGHAEHHEGEHHEKGHKGHKGYKEHHEHDKGKKGHHDKEGHDHHYDEKKGGEKEHHEEAGHHEEHEKGEEGEKKHAYSEKGKHKKGHSTKGEHVVHKKDAYEKKIEFFDEFHEDGEHEKDGAHHHEHHHKKGGHHHKGHHHKGEHEGHHGKKGHHKKGHHHHEKKGHKKEEGEHHHHDHHHKHGKKGGHEDHKHWHHKKG